MAQGNEHFAAAQLRPGHIITHDRDAAGKSMPIAQALEYPHRCMPLLGMHAAIIFQYLIDGLGEPGQLPAITHACPTMLRRLRESQHLVDSLAVRTIKSRSRTTAHPVYHHSATNHEIKFHSLHPPPPRKDEGLAGVAPS